MDNLQKFQRLLKELFQFESSDLDFGIYRIFNYKRKEIEKFIEERLPTIVEEAFKKHESANLEKINRELEEVKKEVLSNFGSSAINSLGELAERFKDTPLGIKYIEIKQRKEEVEKIRDIKAQVFNDLYNFFSRYYEDGDFVPQHRYSIKRHRYAIPYNGEEIKLYWATADQYYIKTGIFFRDYSFNTNSYRVIFKTEKAEEEFSTNKQREKQRRFILSERRLDFDKDKKELIIYFVYKILSDNEISEIKKKIKDNNDNEAEEKKQIPKQEKINQVIFEKIKKELNNQGDLFLIKALVDQTKNEKPLLLYHINRFTAKNERDYFIHKNLKKFLSDQLDYFIKAEVLDLKVLKEDKFFDKHITRAKVVREIGEKIIDFLSQIEDFQKKLWEKKKFVISTEYVITLDRIKEWTDEGFYNEVVEEVFKNKEQLKEWEDLGFGTIKDKRDLDGKQLPIDTRYFDKDFKFKLLEKISEKYDLDDVLDGVLIKSENFQGLNLLLNKYKEKVQTIYIDPPFNTGQDFLFKDRYQDSSWLSLMENRLELAKGLLKADGNIFLHLDWNADYLGRFLLDGSSGKITFSMKLFGGLDGYQGIKLLRNVLSEITTSCFFMQRTKISRSLTRVKLTSPTLRSRRIPLAMK